MLVFPQGKEEHLEKRPLAFSEGPAFLLKSNLTLKLFPLHIIIRFAMISDLSFYLGRASCFYDLANAREDITKTLAAAVTAQLDHQKQNIIQENDEEFTVLLKGRKTLSEWLTWWKAKVKE